MVADADSKQRKVSKEARKSLVTKHLKRRRAELLKLGCPSDLPLFQNVQRLGRMVTLSDAEQAVLSFVACLSCFEVFREALAPNELQLTDEGLMRTLAGLTGHSYELMRKCLRKDSVLITAGLIRIERDEVEIESKVKLARDLHGVMLDELASDAELSRRLLRPATSGNLTLEDFGHLARDAELLVAYLKGVQASHVKGANILLYGPPGTGKTEFAKALAGKAGLRLFEVGYCDDEGNPIDGEQRLQSLNFVQRALRGAQQAALLFDEVEDVLPGKPSSGLFKSLFEEKSDNKAGKAWINRSLEENPAPTIWITNDANIDPAYLRRFDYSVALRIAPRQVRLRITDKHLGVHAPDTAALVGISELDDLLPAQLERAARVAAMCAQESPNLAWQHVEMSLQRSRALLGQTRKDLKARTHTQYSLNFLNTDADIPAIIKGLRTNPIGSFCLYGPSGTGKSQLARYIADELGKLILIKRPSDLLNIYVGGTEKRIAAMFEQALDEDAVLLLDEADSLLSDRLSATRQWELTQTNELLTQLECFEGMFFATTNLMDKMDLASLRRFSHKVKFDFLRPNQCWALIVQEYLRMGGNSNDVCLLEQKVRKLEFLTPGDIAAVVRRLIPVFKTPSAGHFLDELTMELSVKSKGKGHLGFLS